LALPGLCLPCATRTFSAASEKYIQFVKIYVKFFQWGAMAVAERIFHDHDLNLDAIKEVRLTKSKRAR